jgi:hypothetical protein
MLVRRDATNNLRNAKSGWGREKNLKYDAKDGFRLMNALSGYDSLLTKNSFTTCLRTNLFVIGAH